MSLPERREDILIQAEVAVPASTKVDTDWVETGGFSQAIVAGQASSIRVEHSLDASAVDETDVPTGTKVVDLRAAYVRLSFDRTGSSDPPSTDVRASLRGFVRL